MFEPFDGATMPDWNHDTAYHSDSCNLAAITGKEREITMMWLINGMLFTVSCKDPRGNSVDRNHIKRLSDSKTVSTVLYTTFYWADIQARKNIY